MTIKTRDAPIDSQAEPSEALLTVMQVSQYLHLNEYTIRDMLRSGELRGSKVKSKWLVSKQDIKEFILSKLNKPR